MNPVRAIRLAMFCALTVLAGCASMAPPRAARAPVMVTPHFALYSDFEANLNDALIAEGDARHIGPPVQFHTGDEASCFGGLSASARAGWNDAAGYYAQSVSPGGSFGRPQMWIRAAIVGYDEVVDGPAAHEFVDRAREWRVAAAPAYRACRWTVQDAKNRRWIDALRPRLAADEATIASRLEALYQKRWGVLPIPVDVVETVDWSGANSILHDGGGHLLISNAYAGAAALEVVFHEASHLLMDRDDPVQRALAGAAADAGVRLPRDLWHVVLFYTTGEVVRRVLAGEGTPDYTPIVYGIFARSREWNAFRAPLETRWQPYVDGTQSLPEAAIQLVEAVAAKPAQPSPDPRAPDRARRQ
jgi:hypothetical protein